MSGLYYVFGVAFVVLSFFSSGDRGLLIFVIAWQMFIMGELHDARRDRERRTLPRGIR